MIYTVGYNFSSQISNQNNLHLTTHLTVIQQELLLITNLMKIEDPVHPNLIKHVTLKPNTKRLIKQSPEPEDLNSHSHRRRASLAERPSLNAVPSHIPIITPCTSSKAFIPSTQLPPRQASEGRIARDTYHAADARELADRNHGARLQSDCVPRAFANTT